MKPGLHAAGKSSKFSGQLRRRPGRNARPEKKEYFGKKAVLSGRRVRTEEPFKIITGNRFSL
ncbi:MAG: hypothetical protein C0490_18120 [Marivirga sp.]|nr:hypothetical protein [Marivirga sp.]